MKASEVPIGAKFKLLSLPGSPEDPERLTGKRFVRVQSAYSNCKGYIVARCLVNDEQHDSELYHINRDSDVELCPQQPLTKGTMKVEIKPPEISKQSTKPFPKLMTSTGDGIIILASGVVNDCLFGIVLLGSRVLPKGSICENLALGDFTECPSGTSVTLTQE